MSSDEEDRVKLERWLAAWPATPNIFEVLRSGRPGVIRGYLTRAFREATAEAVQENERVAQVRATALETFAGDSEQAEDFLRSIHPSLGTTPLRATVQSKAEAEVVAALLSEIKESQAGYPGPALRAFFGLASAWRLTELEQMKLLGLTSRTKLGNWKAGRTSRVSRDTVERISYLLGIFKAINILLPDRKRADGWIRAPNQAPVFGGRSALELMASGDVGDLRRVRVYLDQQLGGGADPG